MDDKRCAPRVMKRLEVKFHTIVENTAITSNLSETGMFIRTNRGATPGSVIKIRLNLPNASELSLTGKVVRSMRKIPGLTGDISNGMGVQLISPPQNYIHYVHSFFEQDS